MTSYVPRVSVVIPAFNEPVSILAESFASLLSQSFEEFECIVVDESTDPKCSEACFEECAKDRRFRYLHPRERIGLAASLNLGISVASGDLIARFDADDVCMNDRLQRQIEFMDSNPQVGVLGGGLEIIGEAGETIAFRSYAEQHKSIAKQFQLTTAIAHPTVMFRKRIIEEYGGYDPSFRYSEDLDLWLRLLARGVRFANLPATLVKYRQPTTHRSVNHWKSNLRARIRNFRPNFLPHRLCGIVAIAAWSRVPPPIQDRLIHSLLLDRSKPSPEI